MQLLVSAGKAFVGALAGAFIAMLITYWLGVASFQLWAAIGMAVGISLAVAAKAQWQLSRSTYALLTGLLVGVGSVVGMWLPAHV